jgi:hypothetical protein
MAIAWSICKPKISTETSHNVVHKVDTVWTNGLLYKLINYKLPTYLITFLKSYLSDRKFSVTIDGSSSSCHPLMAGLPQGAVLSPILFILYTADYPKISFVQTAMYADDTALFSQSWRPDTIARRLSHATTRLAACFKLWRLKVNMDKTETILFTKRRPDHPPLQGMTIPWSSEVKYLGLRLTQTLNYSPHIKRQIGKAIGALIKLFPILSKESTLTTSTKILLYKTSILRSPSLVLRQ